MSERPAEVRQRIRPARGAKDAYHVAHEVPPRIAYAVPKPLHVPRSKVGHKVHQRLARRHVGLVGKDFQQRVDGVPAEHPQQAPAGRMLGRLGREHAHGACDQPYLLGVREALEHLGNTGALRLAKRLVAAERRESRRAVGRHLEVTPLDQHAEIVLHVRKHRAEHVGPALDRRDRHQARDDVAVGDVHDRLGTQRRKVRVTLVAHEVARRRKVDQLEHAVDLLVLGLLSGTHHLQVRWQRLLDELVGCRSALANARERGTRDVADLVACRHRDQREVPQGA